MANIFFTSDTHFGHLNKRGTGIIDYCKRPFKDIIEMDNALIENWNRKVSMYDIVYHLGDFSFYNFSIAKLNGYIQFIKGNHDAKKWPDFAVVKFKGKKILLRHKPFEKYEDISYPQCDIIFCGHVHEKWLFKICKSLNNESKLMINVGVDMWNFEPVTFDEIMKNVRIRSM